MKLEDRNPMLLNYKFYQLSILSEIQININEENIMLNARYLKLLHVDTEIKIGILELIDINQSILNKLNYIINMFKMYNNGLL